jgi:hypothetical protein
VIFFPEAAALNAGLPDGIFSKQKSQFGSILEGFGIENYFHVAIWNMYITAIWQLGGIFAPVLVYCIKKSGNPGRMNLHR